MIGSKKITIMESLISVMVIFCVKKLNMIDKHLSECLYILITIIKVFKCMCEEKNNNKS